MAEIKEVKTEKTTVIVGERIHVSFDEIPPEILKHEVRVRVR